MKNRLLGALGAALLLSVTSSAHALILTGPSLTGGYITVESSGACQGYCAEGTDFIANKTWIRSITGGDLSVAAGGMTDNTSVKASINGLTAGGRIIASHADTYTLHGPATAGSVPFLATLDVTGIRSPLANTAVGFGTFGRSSFITGSYVFNYLDAHPINVNETLYYSLNVAVGSAFSFSTIVDLLVRAGQLADFSSTAVLGFELPEGYYVTSVEGFSGVGSRVEQISNVPEPGSLALLGLSFSMLVVARHRRYLPR